MNKHKIDPKQVSQLIDFFQLDNEDGLQLLSDLTSLKKSEVKLVLSHCGLKNGPEEHCRKLEVFFAMAFLITQLFEGDRKKVRSWWNAPLSRLDSSTPKILAADGRISELLDLVFKRTASHFDLYLPNRKYYLEAL